MNDDALHIKLNVVYAPWFKVLLFIAALYIRIATWIQPGTFKLDLVTWQRKYTMYVWGLRIKREESLGLMGKQPTYASISKENRS